MEPDRRRWPIALLCLAAIPLLSLLLHRDLLGPGPGLREILADLPRHDGRPWAGQVVPIEEVRRDHVIVIDDRVRLTLLGAMPDARRGTWISFRGRFDAGAGGLRILDYHVHHTRIHKIRISILAAALLLLWWARRHRLVRRDGRFYLALRDA